jgi:hypothetical protein
MITDSVVDESVLPGFAPLETKSDVDDSQFDMDTERSDHVHQEIGAALV